jgi:hypothetical protein
MHRFRDKAVQLGAREQSTEFTEDVLVARACFVLSTLPAPAICPDTKLLKSSGLKASLFTRTRFAIDDTALSES